MCDRRDETSVEKKKPKKNMKKIDRLWNQAGTISYGWISALLKTSYSCSVLIVSVGCSRVITSTNGWHSACWARRTLSSSPPGCTHAWTLVQTSLCHPLHPHLSSSRPAASHPESEGYLGSSQTCSNKDTNIRSELQLNWFISIWLSCDRQLIIQTNTDIISTPTLIWNSEYNNHKWSFKLRPIHFSLQLD